MFAKPINLILVYIVTVFNIAILASPLLALLVPFLNQRHFSIDNIDNDLLEKIKLAAFILLFLVSFFMLFYMFLDFLFSFSLRSALKGCKRFDKLEDYEFLAPIFEDAKYRFDEKSIKLYIKESSEINAYAISSLSKKAVVLTSGLVNHYLALSNSPKEFLYSLRSIIGHEMSHLINKDFLPTFLIIANVKATNFVSYLLDIIFRVILRFTNFLPYGGRTSSRLMVEAYNILDFSIRFFNRFIVSNLYEFLRRFTSRSIEYRCDYQSAQAFGGDNMAQALNYLGESGYFTLFSTHPGTKSRIKKVKNVEISDNAIKPRFLDSLCNYLSIMLLIVTCIFLAKKAQIDLAIAHYIQNHELLNRKLGALWHLVSKFF